MFMRPKKCKIVTSFMCKQSLFPPTCKQPCTRTIYTWAYTKQKNSFSFKEMFNVYIYISGSHTEEKGGINLRIKHVSFQNNSLVIKITGCLRKKSNIWYTYKITLYLLSARSVLFPTSMMITSLPLSVLTSSIHFVVCWNELTSGIGGWTERLVLPRSLPKWQTKKTKINENKPWKLEGGWHIRTHF